MMRIPLQLGTRDTETIMKERSYVRRGQMSLSTVFAFPLAVEFCSTHQFLWILDIEMEPLVNFKFRQPLVDILGCHLDYTLSELQSRNGEHS